MQANLLDIIGEVVTPKLSYFFHSHRSSTSETRVRAQIRQLIDSYTVDLDSFKWTFNEWLETTSVGNNCTFWAYYKLIEISNGFEVWHLNAEGDPDRLICTVTKKEVSHGA